jgi:hypothetical protein
MVSVATIVTLTQLCTLASAYVSYDADYDPRLDPMYFKQVECLARDSDLSITYNENLIYDGNCHANEIVRVHEGVIKGGFLFYSMQRCNADEIHLSYERTVYWDDADSNHEVTKALLRTTGLENCFIETEAWIARMTAKDPNANAGLYGNGGMDFLSCACDSQTSVPTKSPTPASTDVPTTSPNTPTHTSAASSISPFW